MILAQTETPDVATQAWNALQFLIGGGMLAAACTAVWYLRGLRSDLQLVVRDVHANRAETAEWKSITQEMVRVSNANQGKLIEHEGKHNLIDHRLKALERNQVASIEDS